MTRRRITKKVRIPIKVTVKREVRFKRSIRPTFTLPNNQTFICDGCGMEHLISFDQDVVHCDCGKVHDL